MSWCRAHSGTCDQILLPIGMLLSESCGLVSVGRPLWREDGCAICRAITQWSEFLRTRNHTSLSHLSLPPTWRARVPYPPETGWPGYTPWQWVPSTSPLMPLRSEATLRDSVPNPSFIPYVPHRMWGGGIRGCKDTDRKMI
jgi:hypothetical protein